jgi:hypothetical protein
MEAGNRVSVGAGSDSTYEYFLKYWLLNAKRVGREGGMERE